MLCDNFRKGIKEMASSKLRKVKEVNGWKVNHPHSAANIFYIIFGFIIIASPLAFLFLDTVSEYTVPFTVISRFNGIDLLKFGINYIQFLVTGEAPVYPELMLKLMGPENSFLYPIIPYLYTVSAGLLAVMIVFSFVLLIIWVVYLVKGYLRHSRVFRVFTALDFVICVLQTIIYIVLYFYATATVGSISGPFFYVWNNTIILGGMLIFLIVISAIYGANFKDSIPEADLEYHDDEPVVEHLTKVHEVTKVKYEGSSTLPPNLKNIGGHAFAENQNLVIANIPLNITKLGNSAFANCLKLKVVSIPESVVDIGFNCFFNCAELERINYAGTKAMWKKITRGSNWLAKAKTTEVVCIDGSIIVNPYH